MIQLACALIIIFLLAKILGWVANAPNRAMSSVAGAVDACADRARPPRAEAGVHGMAERAQPQRRAVGTKDLLWAVAKIFLVALVLFVLLVGAAVWLGNA